MSGEGVVEVEENTFQIPELLRRNALYGSNIITHGF